MNNKKLTEAVRDKVPEIHESTIYPILIIVVSIFILEGLIMLILSKMPPLPSERAEGLFDASLLVVLATPVLYFFLLRPLVMHINEQKQAEEALKASEEQFRELFESSYDGIYLLDTEGRFSRVNRAFEEITGYKREGLLDKNFFDILDNAVRDSAKKRFKAIIEGGEPVPAEFRIIRKDKDMADVEVRSSPIKKGKRIVGIQESIKDITMRLAFERELEVVNTQLEESNRLKGLFTDIMRHDLLNPTGVVRNIAEIMEYDEKLKGSREIDVIKRNVKKIEDIIQSASEYAKLESEEELEKTELDLAELIAIVIDDLGTYARDKKMNVEFRPKGKHKIKASHAIESVFVNILSNAIKYSPEGTNIKIAIEDDGKSKKISIADQGDGIADEHKEAVFDRFTRQDKAGVKGTGLGLAITKRIVNLHSGKVWVEDNPEGKGTVFIVEIPK